VLATLAALVLISASFSLPAQVFAANGYLEDCDFDGYDQTRGDPNPVPGDWDGRAGSYDPYGTAGHISTGSSAGSSGSSGSSAAAGNGSSAAAGGGSSNSAAASGSSGTTGGGAASSSTDAVESADVAAQGAGSAAMGDAATPLSGLSAAAAAVVGVKGTLEVTPESGSSFTPGARIVIKGASFAGSVKELQLTISSTTPQALTTTASNAQGGFEATAVLPSDLELGKHDIIVAYEGSPIVKRTIEVVEATAPEQTANASFLVGVVILLALAIIAAAALLGWRATKKRRAAAQGG
jgi:hypothetical protein